MGSGALYDQFVVFIQTHRLDQLFFAEVIPPALIVIMFGMGLSLTLVDLKRVIIMPKAAAIGLTGQLVFLPMLAFALITIIQPAPVVAVGAIILAACPGGVTSNAYVFAARADIALSVMLTTIASIVTVFTIPLLTMAALDFFMADEAALQLEFWRTVWTLAKLTILPVAAGMTFNAIWPEKAARSVNVFRHISLALLISIVVVAVLGSLQDFRENIAEAGMLAVALNITAMTTGYLAARLFRLSRLQSVTIIFEIGVQNLALATLVTLTLLNRPDLFVFTIVYGLVMKFTAISLLALAPRLMAGERC